jgi:DNA-binding NarL/FixJ family response regulator
MAGNRVLVVDDNAKVRRGLRTVLALAGDVEVLGEAEDGREAIRQVEALRPDVVVMDLEMPVMDGYEATRQIKSRYPACRVIALTIHGDEAARQRADQAGVHDFIVKGAPMDSLIYAMTKQKEWQEWKQELSREDTTSTGCACWRSPQSSSTTAADSSTEGGGI